MYKYPEANMSEIPCQNARNLDPSVKLETVCRLLLEKHTCKSSVLTDFRAKESLFAVHQNQS